MLSSAVGRGAERRFGTDREGHVREIIWDPGGTLLQAGFNQSLANSFPKGWWGKLRGKGPERCRFKESGQNVIIYWKD